MPSFASAAVLVEGQILVSSYLLLHRDFDSMSDHQDPATEVSRCPTGTSGKQPLTSLLTCLAVDRKSGTDLQCARRRGTLNVGEDKRRFFSPVWACVCKFWPSGTLHGIRFVLFF